MGAKRGPSLKGTVKAFNILKKDPQKNIWPHI